MCHTFIPFIPVMWLCDKFDIDVFTLNKYNVPEENLSAMIEVLISDGHQFSYLWFFLK